MSALKALIGRLQDQELLSARGKVETFGSSKPEEDVLGNSCWLDSSIRF